MSGSKLPPAEPPDFKDLTSDAVLAETEKILDRTRSFHDQLVATTTPSCATFANVVRPIIDDDNRASSRLIILSQLLAQLSPAQDVRQAAREAERKIEAARVRKLMRQDVAALVFAVYARETSAPSENLDTQDQHLLTRMRADYERSGAGIQLGHEHERFRQASNEVSDLCAAAQDTMIEPEKGVWFDRAELDGVPEDVLATMVQEGKFVEVTFKKSHVAAVMRNATRSKTRRRLLVADRNRLPENIKRLSKVVTLRDEIARLLGFEHHAALKLESRMAPCVEFVRRQLEDLHEGLKPVAMAETDRLAKCKRKFTPPADDDDDDNNRDEVYDWDKTFYGHKLKQNDTNVDLSLLAEYFEVNHTLHAMLTIFQDLFGLDFRPTTISTWHESVLSFKVWDTPSEGGAFVGYLYVDLYEREGKYRGAHCIGIQPGFIELDGTTHYPATALVCSYAHPTGLKPTLLQHNEITTMFHELGHAIHNLVSRTKYALSRSRDYSEIPSNMLENWTWVPDVLIRMGKHYMSLGSSKSDDENNNNDGNKPNNEKKTASTDNTLPRNLAEAVCATRTSFRANAMLGQIWPALFDLAIHTPPTHHAALNMDTTKIWNNTKQRISTTSSGHNPQHQGAGQARFIHMFRHNDAGYFSYPLSIAYAADLFASAFAADPMNPSTGRRWRYTVLEPGASRPEMDILRDFLGREPNIKAILDEICH